MSLLTRARRDRESVLHGETPTGGRRHGRFRGFFKRLTGSNRVVSLSKKPQDYDDGYDDDEYSTSRGEDFASWFRRLFRCNKVAPVSDKDSAAGSPTLSICNGSNSRTENKENVPAADQGDMTGGRHVPEQGGVDRRGWVKGKRVRRTSHGSGDQRGMEMEDLPGVVPDNRNEGGLVVEAQADAAYHADDETTDGEREITDRAVDDRKSVKSNDLDIEISDLVDDHGDVEPTDHVESPVEVQKDELVGEMNAVASIDENEMDEKRMKSLNACHDDIGEEAAVTYYEGQEVGEQIEKRQEQFVAHMAEVDDLLNEVEGLVNSIPEAQSPQQKDYEMDYEIETYIESGEEDVDDGELTNAVITCLDDESEVDEETLAAIRARNEQEQRHDKQRRKSQFDTFMAEIDEILERQEAMEKEEEMRKNKVARENDDKDATIGDADISAISEEKTTDAYESDFEEDNDAHEMKVCVYTEEKQEKDKTHVSYMETYAGTDHHEVEATLEEEVFEEEVFEEEVEASYASDFEKDEGADVAVAETKSLNVINDSQETEALYESDFEDDDIEEEIVGFVTATPQKKEIIQEDPTEVYVSDFEEEEIEEKIETIQEEPLDATEGNEKLFDFYS